MDPKEILLKHFEKLVAGVFGAWLVYTVVAFAALKPKELSQNDQLKAGLEQIDKHMQNFEVKLDAIADPTKDLKHQLDPAEVPGAEPFAGWLCHRRPSFVYEVAVGPQKQFPKHKPPVEFHITDKGRGKVSMAWKPSPENQFIKITRYDVLRKDGPSGEYKVVDQVSGDKTEFTDTTVGARAKYWYGLVEHADTDRDDPVIAKDKTELDQNALDLKAEDIADPVETPQDVYITIDGGNPPDPTKDGDAAKGSIDVKVWRWHAGTNQFVSKGFRGILEGKKVGDVDNKFMINKKPEKVDFGTQAVIEEVGQADHQRKGLPQPVKSIYAKIRWPWMSATDEPETIWEKEFPAEIEAQKKGK